MSESLVERLRAITANSFIAREAADEIERLQEEARRWYHADGNSELLSTTEECVKRRIGAALIIANAKEAIETSYDGEPERPLWEKIMAVCSAGHTMARRLVEQEAVIATLPKCNGLRDGEPVDDEPAYPGMSCRVRLRWIAGHPIVAGTIQSVTKTTATVSTDGYPTSEVELSDCYNSTAAAEKAREESDG